MRNIFLSAILISFVFTQLSCKKDTNDPGSVAEPVKYQYLLKSIHWDSGIKQDFVYNNDSTLNYAAASLGTSVGVVNYVWKDKQLMEQSQDGSLYVNRYSYNDKGLVSHILNTYKQDPSHVTYKLEYSYNPDNTISVLKHYSVNEAGSQLKNNTHYEYKSNGDLYKIITESGNALITQVIDSYSGECEIYPWIFVSSGLDEHYTIYNYPVLSKLKKFPTKISRILQKGQSTPEIERIETNTLTLAGKRIDKVAVHVEYPKYPELEWNDFMIYNY